MKPAGESLASMKDFSEEKDNDRSGFLLKILNTTYLSQCLAESLSSNFDWRSKGEYLLTQASSSSPFAFAFSLLHLVTSESLDHKLRLAASIRLKTHLQLHHKTLLASQVSLIETMIFCVSFSHKVIDDPELNSRLREACNVCRVDSWQQPLFDLVTKILDFESYPTFVIDIITILNSIASELTEETCSFPESFTNIYCFKKLIAFVFDIFFVTDATICSSTSLSFHRHIEVLILSSKVIKSLYLKENDSLLIPTTTYDHLLYCWMEKCGNYLLDSKFREFLELQEGVSEWVLIFLNGVSDLHVKDEISGLMVDPFTTFLEDTYQKGIKQNVIVSAMKALTKMFDILSRGLWEFQLGNSYVAKLHNRILMNIVIPNLRLGDEDEVALCKGTFVKGTKRGVAHELLIQIATDHASGVSKMVSAKIKSMLEGSDVDWRTKECTIQLAASSLVFSPWPKKDHIDVVSFIDSVILPELQSKNVNEFLLLKASSLEFLTTFRYHVPQHLMARLMPNIERLLVSNCEIVRSYAATCIESFEKDREGKKISDCARDLSSIASLGG